ncbi:hypothetical protein QOZ80_9AG0683080 [Eleusine coracana subsp. coracana]|nr:hypothetical protein QOZ80_9AG0683080 [Eleusine coracana subsp. coracana]
MHLVDHQRTFSISFSGTFKTPKQFPFSQDGGIMPNAFRPNTLLAEDDSHTRSSLSSTLGPECALSLLSSSLHRLPSPITCQAQQATSSLASQDAATPSTVGYASDVARHAFIPDSLFEDPSQALPFIWQ